MTVPKTNNTSAEDAASLNLPRILCLHGGGVNGRVFALQSRTIIAHLRGRFRLVFLDGPYTSPPHPDILRVYGEMAPFYRWLRWLPEHPEVEARIAAEDVVRVVREAMERDKGRGEWVGVLGFSQGAKIAASLLWAQQAMEKVMGAEDALTSFKFGVIMAGRGPIVHLDMRLPATKHISEAGILSGLEDAVPEKLEPDGDHIVSIPTVHVHGLEDPGLPSHRLLLERYFKPGTTRLVEWHAGHRLPFKTVDVTRVVDAVLATAKDAGVL